jgi:hypothetical protein
MPPPIRYPLPTLVVLVFLGLLFWRGEAWTRSLRSALAARVARVVEGPPLPQSDHPQVRAGLITRRALLLHDDVPVTARPGGPVMDTIRHRMFVDVYDVWPLQGDPTHYRVGNRRPLGWVQGKDLLAWDTRLVVRREGVSVPVLEWPGESLTIAQWDSANPWFQVDRIASLPTSSLKPDDWGVWLSRIELLAVLRRTFTSSSESPERLRLRIVLGRLLDDRPLSDEDVKAARAALPAQALTVRAASLDEARDRLARLNEQWAPESSWGGLAFECIPLDALP